MNIITLDFETYYDKDYSLSKITTEEYIRDPRFEVIGFSYAINQGPIQWFTGDMQAVREQLYALPWEDSLLLAQNTAFDGAILHWVFGIKPAGYLDTMSMAKVLHGLEHGVSLASLAKIYNLPDKGTAVVRALGLRRTDFSTIEMEEYGEYCDHDVWLCREIFKQMMANGFPPAELKVVDQTIRMYAEPKLVLNQALLEQDLIRIKAAKRASLLRLMNHIGVSTEEEMLPYIMSNKKFAQLMIDYGVEPPTKISPTTGKEAYAFAKTDEEFTLLAESDDPIIATMVATRLETKSTIMETRTESFIGVAKRGVYPFPISYSGATVSHRWSGYDLNPQNLPRGSMLRQAIEAPKGYVLVVSDLSNIELRMGLWLAKQYDRLQLLASGRDLYKAFAAEVFNLNYEDIAKDSTERFVGKESNLALIYGTGDEKLRNTIRLRSKGKVVLDAKEALRIKNFYRETNNKIVDAWGIGGDIIEWIYHDQHHTAYDLLEVQGKKGIVKPNGLILPYPNLRQRQGDKGMEWVYSQRRGKNYIDDKVYSAKCFQRCVQSLSRDVIAEMTVKIGKELWVAGLVHDEVIAVVPEGEAQQASAFIKEVMSTPPVWAPTLPLACEVGVGVSYGKAK